jgi:hypothetical protein
VLTPEWIKRLGFQDTKKLLRANYYFVNSQIEGGAILLCARNPPSVDPPFDFCINKT